MTHAIRWVCDPLRIGAFVLAVCLILFGFLIDGVSEPGHHAGLVLGGIVAGLGLARK